MTHEDEKRNHIIEGVANEIDFNDALNALNYTQKIIDDCGPRLTGAESTKKAAEIIEKDIVNICDQTFNESFEVHPNAFLGWIKLLVTTLGVAVFSFWINIPLVGGITVTFGIIIMVLQFFQYKEVIDPLWKKKTGYNVFGYIEPAREIKQQIIVSGHHDSAYIFNFLVKQPGLYPARLYGGMGSVFIIALIGLVWGILELIPSFYMVPWLRMTICILSTIMFMWSAQMWFYRGKKGTPGAGDNMISSAIAIEIGKKFANAKKAGRPLNNTRLIIASWDAEEAGLRGSRAFCKRHKEELLRVPTYVYNMDCPYMVDEIFFLTSDINGSVKLSQKMAVECVSIAERFGYKVDMKPIAFLTGGTDAGEFGKIGVAATNLMAMPWGNSDRASVYHTPEDKVEAIEPEAVLAAMRIGVRFIEQKDSEQSNND